MVKGNRKGAEINFDLSRVQIPRKYKYPIPLTPAKKADLLVLVSEWVPPAVKRLYWDKVLSEQQEDISDAPDDTGNNLQGSPSDQNDETNDDIEDLDNLPESDEPLLATHVYDYDE